MEPDKKKIIDSFKRFVTQTAREQGCKDDDIIVILYDYFYNYLNLIL